MSGLVIVADDDADILAGYKECLEAANFTVVAVPDGESALARCKQLTPRVVMLDVHMPGMGGIEACRRIRGVVGNAVPVMFVTSDSTASVLQDCLQAGGNDFYIKDGKITEILNRVRMWGHPKLRATMEEKRQKAIQRVQDFIEGRGGIPRGATAFDVVQDELGMGLDDDWDLDDSTALSLDDVAAWRPGAAEAPPQAPAAPAPAAQNQASQNQASQNQPSQKKMAAQRKAGAKPAAQKPTAQKPAQKKAAAKPAPPPPKTPARPAVPKNTEVSWGSPAPAREDEDAIDWENGGLFGDGPAEDDFMTPPQPSNAPFPSGSGDQRAIDPLDLAADGPPDDDVLDDLFGNEPSLGPGAGGQRGGAKDNEDAFWDMLDNPVQDGELPPEPGARRR